MAQITFDTNNLSELDYKILGVVTNEGSCCKSDGGTTIVNVAAPEAEKPAAKKAAPAKKASERIKEPVAAEPEPEVEESGELTAKDALAAARVLVDAGNSAKVKEVLADFGLKKVSDIEDEQVPEFIEALQA